MNSFLGTLLNRHHGKLDVVQPRGLSRFESARSGPAPADFSTMDLASETLLTESFNDHPVRDDTIRDNAKADTSNTVFISPENVAPSINRYKTHAGYPGRNPDVTQKNSKRSQREPEANDIDDHQFRRSMLTPHRSSKRDTDKHSEPRFAEFSAAEKVLLTESDLDHRLSITAATSDEALHRLRSDFLDFESLHRRDASDGNLSENHSHDNRAGNNEPVFAAPVVPMIIPAQKKTGDELQHKADADRDGHAATHAVEAPAWLATLEARFQKRWQNSEARSHDATIVNVSIGRVEVRATRNDQPATKTSKKKPTGVMSLDDYLSQRKPGRGSAT